VVGHVVAVEAHPASGERAEPMFRGELGRQPFEEPVHTLPKAFGSHLTPSRLQCGTSDQVTPSGRCVCFAYLSMVGVMDWLHLFAICLLCWLAVALAVGTIVGHGIALGSSGDPD
jgi:hypothetical protein